MSKIYDQDYVGLEGVNYPEDGTPFYQQDFVNEQDGIGGEVIDRESDFFSTGIIKGFDVTESGEMGCIDVSVGIARDNEGRRIVSEVEKTIEFPDTAIKIVAIRHEWIFENYVLDGTDDTKQKRIHSANVDLYDENFVPPHVLRLAKVQRQASILMIEDLRSFASLSLPNITPTQPNEAASKDYVDKIIFKSQPEIYAAAQHNLVYNYDFRYFSNQQTSISAWYDYLHPDGYQYIDTGSDGRVGYDTSIGCCKILTSSNGSGTRIFRQALHEFVNWRNTLKGATVTLCAFVKGGNAIIKLTDGITISSYELQNAGTIEEIDLQIEISNLATELTFSVESSVPSNTLEIYKVFANKGEIALESLPCIVQGIIGEVKTHFSAIAPPGEFFLDGSTISAMLGTGYTRLVSVLHNKFGSNKLPDLRGRFLRGWANGSANDPDRISRTNRGDGIAGDKVGTLQADAMRALSGTFPSVAITNNEGAQAPTGVFNTSSLFGNGLAGTTTNRAWTIRFNNNIVTTGGDNRPNNIATYFTINWGRTC